MSNAIRSSLTLAALVLLAASPLTAQGRRDRRPAAPAKAAVSVTFTASERDIIVGYYKAHPYRARALPPGIAKNLARGKPLPPGIARRALPAALIAELPRRTGVEITVFGDRIVLLEAGGLVVDVLEGVFH